MFFGRVLSLLLVILFSLSGAGMVLSELQAARRFGGQVLGEESGNKSRRENRKKDKDDPTAPFESTSVVPTEVVTPASPTASPFAEGYGGTQSEGRAPTEAVTTAPTIIITPEPTSAPTSPTASPFAEGYGGTQSEGRAIETMSVPVEVRSSTGSVVTITSEIDRSTGETVRQIVRKLGIRTAAPTTPRVSPVIKQAVEVVEEKTAGEILSELGSIRGETDVKEVRLRYWFVNGKMTLVGETETGRESPLTPEESASILARLQRAAALAVAAGAPGEMVFTKGQIRAVTNLPLLVDLKTNLLTTETSTGIKTVPLLPDEAIKIAFASRVVDGIYPKRSSAEIEFKEAENGRLIYQINGLSKRKLFGLLPLTLPETALIEAASGQVSQPEKSLGQLFLELIAFPGKE